MKASIALQAGPTTEIKQTISNPKQAPLTHDPVEPQRLSLFPKMFWHCDRQDTDDAGWILPTTVSPLSNVILHYHTLNCQTNFRIRKCHKELIKVKENYLTLNLGIYWKHMFVLLMRVRGISIVASRSRPHRLPAEVRVPMPHARWSPGNLPRPPSSAQTQISIRAPLSTYFHEKRIISAE